MIYLLLTSAFCRTLVSKLMTSYLWSIGLRTYKSYLVIRIKEAMSVTFIFFTKAVIISTISLTIITVIITIITFASACHQYFAIIIPVKN